MSVAWVGAGIAAVGTVSQMNSAKSAGKAQQAGADAATASQEYMFDETNRLNKPFYTSGVSANNRLSYLLGIGGTANNPSGTSLADAQLTRGTGYNPDLYASNDNYRRAWDDLAAQHYAAYGKNYNADSDMGWVETNLRKALAGDIEKERAAQAAAQEQNANDPNYGSLLKKFDQNDLNNDVVYQSGLQFGLDQGNQGINRLAAASGSQLSGATLKALTRFGNDYGSTKANEAYNRYNTTNDSIYNKLAGVSGAGQQSTNQVVAAGQNMANNNSATQIGLGNARGASAIAQGNALTNGLSNAYNSYQQNQLMNSLARPQSQAYFGSGGMGGFGDSYSTSYGE